MRCESHNCLNDAVPRKHFCYKCITRKYVAKNPLRATFNYMRKRAKQRGIGFTLTFEEFKEWCEETNYIKLKGTGSNDMSIDRVKAYIGYERGNIQMLTIRENIQKRNKDKPWTSKTPPGVVETGPPAPF